jgi:hypothetical protein
MMVKKLFSHESNKYLEIYGKSNFSIEISILIKLASMNYTKICISNWLNSSIPCTLKGIKSWAPLDLQNELSQIHLTSYS